MEFPPEIAIRSQLQQGVIFYFHDNLTDDDKPHYYVLINPNPNESVSLLFVCLTSQVNKRLVYIQKAGLSTDTLVHLVKDEYDFVTVESVFDCNYIHEKSIEELSDKVTQGRLVIKKGSIVSQDCVSKVIRGIISSKVIDERIKSQLRNWED